MAESKKQFLYHLRILKACGFSVQRYKEALDFFPLWAAQCNGVISCHSGKVATIALCIVTLRESHGHYFFNSMYSFVGLEEKIFQRPRADFYLGHLGQIAATLTLSLAGRNAGRQTVIHRPRPRKGSMLSRHTFLTA